MDASESQHKMLLTSRNSDKWIVVDGDDDADHSEDLREGLERYVRLSWSLV